MPSNGFTASQLSILQRTALFNSSLFPLLTSCIVYIIYYYKKTKHSSTTTMRSWTLLRAFGPHGLLIMYTRDTGARPQLIAHCACLVLAYGAGGASRQKVKRSRSARKIVYAYVRIHVPEHGTRTHKNAGY